MWFLYTFKILNSPLGQTKLIFRSMEHPPPDFGVEHFFKNKNFPPDPQGFVRILLSKVELWKLCYGLKWWKSCFRGTSEALFGKFCSISECHLQMIGRFWSSVMCS